MALVRQSASLYNRVKGKQMNESPNEFFVRLIAHNEVLKNIADEKQAKEDSRIKQVKALEHARSFQ